jgi:hypothetical protein
MSLTLHVRRIVVFLYAGSRRLLPNLADMCRKPSASFGLHVDRVPMVYHRVTEFKCMEVLVS